MFQRRVDLVGEFVAVYGGAATSGARRVAALDHEVGDDAVEDGVGVVAALDEGGEVGAGLGGVGGVQFEGYGALYVEEEALVIVLFVKTPLTTVYKRGRVMRSRDVGRYVYGMAGV